MTKEIIDQDARTKIEQELSTNFLIEAGAGSGKTTSLVSRMVNLIYTGTCRVEEIVAITFTKKAADELKLRFQSEIEKAWKKEQQLTKQKRLGEALQRMDQCFLGTVHAFCAKLLRERPIEANLDINFLELEDNQDRELLEESWNQFLQSIQDKNPEVLDNLLEKGIRVDNLFENVKMMKNYPDVEWVTTPIAKPDLQDTFKTLKRLLNDAKRALPKKEPQKGYDKLQSSITSALRKIRHIHTNQDKDIIDVFEEFDKNLKPTYNRWENREDAEFYYTQLTRLFEAEIAPLMKQWREYIHPMVISFIHDALEVYEKVKNERSLLNFQDLLRKTNTLLKEHTEVRKYFQQKYRYLLVDEFQDTDPIQAEMMFYLTSVNTNETEWTRCEPLPGSLFVVGDPKQAIYRFRRADMDTYNRVKELMIEQGGEVLSLTMNFRTLNSVTEKLNQVFEQQFPKAETAYQAAYRPLNAFHKDKQSDFYGIKTLTVPEDYSKKDEVIQKDGENISQAIQQLLKQGFQAKDFMVLTRYNEGIGRYAQILEKNGLPVSVSGEMIIGDMVEFKELMILLKALIDPTDAVMFTAALRGIFFGISDDELYQWKKAGGRFSIYSKVPNQLKSKAKDKFSIAITRLKTYYQWVRNLSPITAIDKVIEDIGFYPLLVINKHGRQAQKSLLQILEAIRQNNVKGISNYRNICTLLEKMVEEKTTVINMEEETDAVRIMNIHKSKGLEAPIVCLAHPWKHVNPETSIRQHIKRDDFSSKGYFAFSKNTGTFHKKSLAIPLQWEEYKQEELRYLTEEEARILYVAATRAERALVISKSARNNKKNPWKKLLEVTEIEDMNLLEEKKGLHVPNEKIITYEDYMKRNHNQLEWMKQSEIQSFASFTPTTNKEYEEVLDLDREAGGGKEWGTIIHTALEHIVKGNPIDRLVPNVLSSYDMSAEREKKVYDYIKHFKQSDIWHDLQKAETFYTEVPFGLRVERGNPLYHLIATNEHVDVYHVKGIIDLVYKVNNRWNIVDYKTDRIKKEQDLKKVKEFYQAQIVFYQKAWEYLTKEPTDAQIWGLFSHSY
ncbi:ATP-dependent helicase/nuclease subunit A [Salinibacillus kushneri]|uniref:DNA 3'-5' helicase n=1 Tax=Salinibacillus kushneri TaxID=237682 RepID=A0A1I0DPF9_9BACI|nr:UvrD-helicase domain-containing protein [Salinibacillus kushneri]SET34442.1 ATP-dependent helicase/nuclease subunit A [Salinibacillus kushneri]